MTSEPLPALDPYLRQCARTQRFTRGAPRAVTVSPGGDRVLFLRSTGPVDPVDALWLFDATTGQERLLADPAALSASNGGALPPEEAALRERTRLTAAGIGTYATDEDLRTIAFALDGRLFCHRNGEITELPTAGPVFDPRPALDGSRIAYVTEGALHVVEGTTDRVLAAEAGARWGFAEFVAAEELGRSRGYWWSPDGSQLLVARVDETDVPVRTLVDPTDPEARPRKFAYPRAGGPNADVSLHLLGLEVGRTEISWDRARFPYVTDVSWSADALLITVADRLQQRLLLLSVELDSGETKAVSDQGDPCWVEPVTGTPMQLPDGRILRSEDVRGSHGTRLLLLDDVPITPPRLYVRAVVGVVENALVVTAGVDDEPSEQHLFRVTFDGQYEQLTDTPGFHAAVTGGNTLVVSRSSLAEPQTSWTVHHTSGTYKIRSFAATPPVVNPVFSRVTAHRLPAAVLYPRDHRPGQRLPVLLDPYGGPGGQMVVRQATGWIRRQWWADQGFAVVVIDGRGTSNVSPEFTYAVFRGWSSVVLDDQVHGLHALADLHPDLDLARVAVRGWSFGGYLAALAVLRRPDVFHAAVAGAPPTDFQLYDTAYTERYLGLPQDNPEVYEADALLADAPRLTRPLLLVHGLADDNVHPLHSFHLSEALHDAGRPHAVLPLPGVTHMTPDGIAERTMVAELDFIRRALS